MIRICLFVFALVVSALAAETPPSGVRHVSVGADGVVNMQCSTFQYCTVILPEKEKALNALCGDKAHFDVIYVEGAERYVNIKPSPGAHATDIQIITDHGHEYTVTVTTAAANTPPDLKVFIDPEDVESLEKPPTLYSSSDYHKLEQQVQAMQAETDSAKKKAASEVQQNSDEYRSAFVHKVHHDYRFKAEEPPFNISAVYTDGKFTFIEAKPELVAAIYAVRDGKPDLVQFDYADGVYTVREVMTDGYLQLGKKKSEIHRIK